MLIVKIVCGSSWVTVLWGRRFQPRERSLTAASMDVSWHTLTSEGLLCPQFALICRTTLRAQADSVPVPSVALEENKLSFCAEAKGTPLAEDKAVLQTQILNSTQPPHLCRRKIQAFLIGVQGLLPPTLPHCFTFMPTPTSAASVNLPNHLSGFWGLYLEQASRCTSATPLFYLRELFKAITG